MQFFTVRFIGSISAAGGAAGLFQFPLLREGRRGKSCTTSSFLRFQFTLLREGRLPTVCHASPPKAFQFTPLREGRLDDVMNALKPILFQFTPLREGRPGQAEEQLQRWMISIHAPPRGATHKVILRGQNIVFISIHAPPRGATPYARCIRASRDISIHAPPRGATATAASTETPSRFQFTPLREGRRASGETSNGAENFNSRPSARGDGQQGYLGLHQGYFNSRPSARGDIPSMNATRRGFLFQFTPLREGRRHEGIHEREPSHFNSRPSARGDNMDSGWDFTALISIHAPPRGATSARIAIYCRDIFQFTPLREGRLPPLVRPCGITNFNSRPSARGDGGIRAPRPGRLHFNSRPSARGDCADVRDGAVTDISIHAPPRGATSQRQMGLTTSVDFNSRPSARGDEPAS